MGSGDFIHNGLCNCDGRTQFFAVVADTKREVEAKVQQAEAVGYTRQPPMSGLSGGECITQLVDAKWEKMEKWIAIMSTDQPSLYVNDYSTFLTRCGLAL